jgi:N-acetylglucosamine-6-sulfatase
MRRVVASAVLSLLAASAAAFAQPASPATREHVYPADPNVVFILLDDGRYDDLTTLPDVQGRIGDQGATFTHFYSSFPLCCPARATLLTGQYPHNHGVLSNKAPTGGFKEFRDSSTLATWLDPTYHTGLIGKYFNQYVPPYQPPGWDEWMVPRAMYTYTATGWYVDKGSGGSYVTYPGYQTDTIGNLAVDFVNRNALRTDPFFLYISFVAPHAGNPGEADDPPGIATPAVSNLYRNRFAGLADTDPSFNEADVSDKPIRPSRLTAAEIAGLTEANAQRREAELSAQDQINRVLDAIQASGEMDNTYVMFMSDNGYILGEHRIRGGKVAPYEVSDHVPMMVRGPGIAPGTVIDDVTAQVDFAPTVLSMTGTVIANPAAIDGVNLLPRMVAPATTSLSRAAVVIEATPAQATTDPLPWLYHGVVSSQWKYVERETGRKELYDLANDPYELQNVAGEAAYGATQDRMASLVSTYEWCAGIACR